MCIYLLLLVAAFTRGGLTTPGSTVLCELTRDFYPVLSPSCVAKEEFQVSLDHGCPRLQLVSSSPAPRAGSVDRSRSLIASAGSCRRPPLSPSCVAEDTRFGKGFQCDLERGCLRFELVFSSPAPRTRQCGKGKVLDQLTVGTACSVTKLSEPSLHKQCRYTCKAEAATQFHRWHTISAPYVIVKDRQQTFVGYSYWPRQLSKHNFHHAVVSTRLNSTGMYKMVVGNQIGVGLSSLLPSLFPVNSALMENNIAPYWLLFECQLSPPFPVWGYQNRFHASPTS